MTAKTAAVAALTPKPAAQAAKKKTALATAAPKMAEEEWAALFRNNLLRSCWKPGLTSEEVQHVLTLWERKLVEVRSAPAPGTPGAPWRGASVHAHDLWRMTPPPSLRLTD